MVSKYVKVILYTVPSLFGSEFHFIFFGSVVLHKHDIAVWKLFKEIIKTGREVANKTNEITVYIQYKYYV